MSTETTVQNLKINKLTKAQFDTITPSATEAYEFTDLSQILDSKQETLVSGTNIKTINNQSLLGSGNIDIQGGSTITVDSALLTTSTNPVQNKVITSALDNKQDTLTTLNAGTDISITNTANRNKTVSDDNSVFLENAILNGLNSVTITGACKQNGVPSPSTPLDIVCNNGRLAIENVFDKDAEGAVVNKYPGVVPIGSITSFNDGGSYDFKALLMPARPNTEYVFKRLTDCGSLYNRIRVVSLVSSAPPLTVSSGIMLANVSDTTTPSVTFTTLSTTKGLLISVRDGAVVADDWERFVNNVSVVPTKPYSDGTTEIVEDGLGNIATAENLLSVGDFRDTQEILSGSITRNVGIKILDGTENWTALSGGIFQLSDGTPNFKSQPNNNIGYSNYFSVIPLSTNIGTYISNGQLGWDATGVLTISNTTTQTVTDFKQWLSNLYVQSTPVIILYPLATPTTETVTAQSLTTQAGTNIIQITQASINTLPMSVNYVANDGTLISFINGTGYATETYVNTGLATKQTTSNLVTSISASSTDIQYPSAKCVYDIVGNIETLLQGV